MLPILSKILEKHICGLSYIHLQGITVLRKITRSLPLDQRKLYYNTMIKQTMLHASTVWTSCSVENSQKVFRLPKRAARVMLGADTKANSVKLFKQLGWVPFYHEAKINKSILASRRIIGECPSYLTQMLIRNTDVNGRTSRHGQLHLVCPRFKRESEGGRSFSVSTSRLWNIMPAHFKNQPNLTSFKKSIF